MRVRAILSGGKFLVEPDPVRVLVGEPLYWEFVSTLPNRSVKWEVYFHHSSPFGPTLKSLSVATALAPAAQARPGQQVMFEVPGGSQQTGTLVPQLESLGVSAIRVNLSWYNAAPSPTATTRPAGDLSDPARYDWRRAQALIDAAHQRGWKVTLALAGPAPRCGTEGARDTITRPRASDYEHFAEAAGRHFGAAVTQWSVWNEPNFRTFLMPQFVHGKPASPKIYRGLYLAAQKGLRHVLPHPRVLFGETAPRAGGDGVAPLAFLRGALCLDSRYHRRGGCGRITTDGYAHHPYAPAAGPYFRPAGRDDVTIGSLSRLTTALDRAARAKAISRRVKVYLTEFGVQSYPDRSAGVPLATQSDYRSISERIAWSNPRVYGFSQYLMHDDATISSRSRAARYPGFQTGLETASGRRKPAYDGFRLPLVVRAAGSRVAIWGLVRPARGATRVSVDAATKGHAWRVLKRLRTKRDGSFSFTSANRRGRVWRVRWTAPSGRHYTGSVTKARHKP